VKETAMGERAAVPRALTYQDLTVVAAIRQHNFCVMARKLRFKVDADGRENLLQPIEVLGR
jgi:hypothetical protein